MREVGTRTSFPDDRRWKVNISRLVQSLMRSSTSIKTLSSRDRSFPAHSFLTSSTKPGRPTSATRPVVARSSAPVEHTYILITEGRWIDAADSIVFPVFHSQFRYKNPSSTSSLLGLGQTNIHHLRTVFHSASDASYTTSMLDLLNSNHATWRALLSLFVIFAGGSALFYAYRPYSECPVWHTEKMADLSNTPASGVGLVRGECLNPNPFSRCMEGFFWAASQVLPDDAM
ncbi:hypothetical protein BDK51DRAFT_41366 [Blyttiomyces helicus]|uniref:Uncharacterized protein n=1 Tax=Blyttiomyces helicus TaxID=388810 RepID=A0A4P9WAS0_9FUNG|nr:hypothetical protein BDK51DRAFT_41366 [Blyttiomyces helicus]|eukprot:RKO89554.1 hypothetical protein BDK51DRAFT_41366 [Blyttiomyces helicus]